ncbi:SDR family NAD(P)-dependent oxidoreductase [Propionibacteriaceae bacterium Y2011]
MDDLGLQGRKVLVTGAASGIGRATAEFLIAHGAAVALLDRDAGPCAELGGAVALDCDVTDADGVEAAVAKAADTLGGLDVLLHVAGITLEARTDLRELSEESFRKVVDVNLIGSFLVARACARVMVPAEAGRMVIVGSPAGVTGPSSSIPYGSSKGGVNGLVITLNEHLKKHNVSVMNFMPSAVDTPLVRRSLAVGEQHGADPSVTQGFMDKAVQPADVGRALAMMASPLLSHLRGSVFTR